MGYKSRSNWRVNICLKEDCINRGKMCDECIKFSKYRTGLYFTQNWSEDEKKNSN